MRWFTHDTLMVSFYLPEPDATFAEIPVTVSEYWHWQASARDLFPYWGRYHWVLQTYLYLKDAGLPVELVNRLPESGVIVTHMDCVDYGFRPGARQTLVVLLVDREIPHPHAHLHVTHNPVQQLPMGLRYRYVPPWPQIGLVPRNADRGSRFETVGYFGYANNLDPAISGKDFQSRLASLGLRLVVPPPSTWHDFSEVDAVLALRNLGRGMPHLSKPSLKLFNAWLAGVPAILGHESAYRAEGRPGVDYLEATDAQELLGCLERLKDDPPFRQRIVSNGHHAVSAFAPERTVERWRSLISGEIEPLHMRYCRSAARRAARRVAGSILERVLWRMPNRFTQRAAMPAGSVPAGGTDPASSANPSNR